MSDDKDKDKDKDKVRQKIRKYLKNGQLDDLAGQIIAEMGDEEAQQVQEKFNKIFKVQDDSKLSEALSAAKTKPTDHQQ